MFTTIKRVRAYIWSIYGNVQKRLVYVLNLLDERLPIIDNAKTYLEKSRAISGHMPKTQQHFLLAKVFGLTPKEIETIDGTKQGSVVANIRYVADRIITGEFTFMNPTEEQITNSRKRLDKFKANQRRLKRARDKKRKQKAG